MTGSLDRETRRSLLAEEPQRCERASVTRLLTQGEIQVAEQNLKELGFDPGPVDGIFTEQTRAAVRSFQARRGLPVTGLLDDATRKRLIPGSIRAGS